MGLLNRILRTITKDDDVTEFRKELAESEKELEPFLKYQKELHKVFDKYLALMEIIEKEWSILYNSKDYSSKLAYKIEKECYEAINYYKKVREVDLKYGETPMSGSKAFTKLALLYERQGEFEKAVSVCKQAYSLGMDERKRMLRIIKKVGRVPTEDELNLMHNE